MPQVGLLVESTRGRSCMSALKLLTTRLRERKVLIGGEPGAGRTGALSMVVATTALDPDKVEAGTAAGPKAGGAGGRAPRGRRAGGGGGGGLRGEAPGGGGY